MDYLIGLVPGPPNQQWECIVSSICECFVGVERFTLSPWGSLAKLRGAGKPGAVISSRQRAFLSHCIEQILSFSVCQDVEKVGSIVGLIDTFFL